MVRPIYAHEMCDPDFSWLLSTFRESHPEYFAVESTCLPVVLINFAPPAEETCIIETDSICDEQEHDEPVMDTAEEEIKEHRQR